MIYAAQLFPCFGFRRLFFFAVQLVSASFKPKCVKLMVVLVLFLLLREFALLHLIVLLFPELFFSAAAPW